MQIYPYICNNCTRHASPRKRTTVGLIFYTMQYTKPPLSIFDQVSLLESRGLEIPDTDRAIHYLSNISYYRLRAYWLPFEDPSAGHRFQEGASFDDVLDNYFFDRKLRLLIFDEIERIEIALRTQLIYQYSTAHGGQWYLDANHFRWPQGFIGFETRIKEEYQKSREPFIDHYKSKYTNPVFPPAWVMLEIASFGMLSILYKNLKATKEKKAIAAHFGIHYRVLESWLEALTTLRNHCAHHSRVWNRKFVKRAKYPTNTARPWLTVPIGTNHRNKVYMMLCVINYLIKSINPQTSFPVKLKNLLAEYPNVPVHYMGFPPTWDNDVFWH